MNATGHTSCFDTLLPSNRASFIQEASSDEKGGERRGGLTGNLCGGQAGAKRPIRKYARAYLK